MSNAVITTYYCTNCIEPTKKECQIKFNYDVDNKDFYINFSNYFNPFDFSKIPNIGKTKRKDLVYGKIFKLKIFIENNILGKYDNILHIDYSDTKFTKSTKELFDKFIDSKKDIIISTEKNCWPYIETVSNWFDTKLENKEFYYINSGAVISKVDTFYKILKKLEDFCLNTNIDFWDDQGVWQYMNILENNLNKDEIMEYFFSTSELNESYYNIKNKIITTKFGTEPYLIHDNSSFSLNLINKI